ncbi:glycosyltransferase family 4 protein [Allobaculum mucilyticum]|uniref:glycosyltransferase family 4 protein n=1 Tax=Allobaculum mucilyticum TaxID=2834459 RepID=UPI001E394CDD|nr:glycosyltransferase family 4 protein [Allobaculum mucilyticum]UNT95098.1 glycosyltransferase family 4 protein [Allobaculum mucilyticum]
MKKDKLLITMFSSADSVAGQGVGSAYEEQVSLIEQGASDLFDVEINKWSSNPDIQHFHTIDPAFLMRIKNKSSVNIAYCHFLPDTLEGSLKIPKILYPTARKYIINFYDSADRLVVVNPSFINELVKYNIDRNKIYYIPNYVSKERFHKLSKEDREEMRAKYGLGNDDFVVLGCGQVQTRKGVQDFVKTAEMMPDTKFVWAGGFSFGAITEGYDELKELMDNPPANVVFTGIVDRSDMVRIYNMADVLFIPSYNELFPMTILEAVNLSLPLVTRDLELYRDILFDDYLRGQNNEEFKNLLTGLKNNKETYAFWSRRSDRLSEFYSREHVLQMWREFYMDAWKEKFEGVKDLTYAPE